ncbi:I78 family peptidase inhibitor [Sphingobium aquiterrae]|uniref:I78 family peptidase inhibitor n=1 Tax=Sphingobium aquiterrae TaxID=2038656 RepID=UPI003AFB5392
MSRMSAIVTLAATAAMAPLTACAPMGQQADAGTPPVPAPAGDEGPCKNEAVAQFIGQKATAELGARMLSASGARTLRWGGPGTAMTMDFRPDRLTVSYDKDMAITSARCG